ncbi:hypothetical protein N665_0233s0018 [Sinapis alba]|nr:hypothetical protein N665_0233s0018 [Sinapis alba]
MEEDNAAYTAKQNALKAQLTPKATTTYQEPRQHQPNEKKGKPLTYDETKFCTYHKAKGHDTKECKQLAEALFSAFKSGTITPDPPKVKQTRKKGSWTKNRKANAKNQESNPAVHPDDQDAAAPPRPRDDTNTEDERSQVDRRINLISAHPLTSCSSKDDDNQDLRDRLQRKHSTTDLRDALLRGKKSEPFEYNHKQDLRDRLQHKRSTTDLRDVLLGGEKSEPSEPRLSEDDLRQKLTPKENTATPDLRKTLSDKRPSVFRQINVILGGSPLCNDSLKSINEYQRKAVTAQRWPTKREGETSITFTEGDLTDIDQPHNGPLLVELQIGTCEVTRVLIDTGSSVDLISRQTLIKMMVDLKDIKPSSRALTGFNGSSTQLLGTIHLNVFVGGVSKLVKFSVIDTKTQYNAIMGTPWLHMMKAIPSTYHQCVKFPIREGTVFTLKGNQRLA